MMEPVCFGNAARKSALAGCGRSVDGNGKGHAAVILMAFCLLRGRYHKEGLHSSRSCRKLVDDAVIEVYL
jgi:hypothetical protein